VFAGPFFLALLLTTLLAGLILPALLSVTAAVNRPADRLGPADHLDFAGLDQTWKPPMFSLLFLTETNHRAA